MKKSVKIWVLLAALGIAVGLASGCRKDVYVTPPPSLIGKYIGTYTYQEDNGATLIVDTTQPITFDFSSIVFSMDLDTSRMAESGRVTCDVLGYYSYEGSVVLSYTSPTLGGEPGKRNKTNKICRESDVPEGAFGLQQPADSVLLIQQTTKSGPGPTIFVNKIIRLAPR